MSPSGTLQQPEEYRGRDGRLHLTVYPFRVARKRMRAKHFLQSPPAIAVDIATWDAASLHFDRFEAVDLDTGITRWVTRQDFEAHCGTLARGFGAQYFLPLRRWHVVGAEGPVARSASLSSQLPLPLLTPISSHSEARDDQPRPAA